MYALIDQPVRRLSLGSRFVLWGMRSWAQAVADRMCPLATLAPSFAAMGVPGALMGFHIALVDTNSSAIQKLNLAPIHSTRISEDEAVLLSLWSASLHSVTHTRLHGTLELLLADHAIPKAAKALGRTTATLAAHGLAPIGLDMRATQEAGL